MSIHALERPCLWLEFEGAAGDHAVSNPFSFVRFVADRIEGGRQKERIASLRVDRWMVAPDEAARFSRISGLGVLSVHLEYLDGSALSIECTQVRVDGALLLVDRWAVALFESTRAAWIRLGTEARLSGIRMEPGGAGRAIASQRHPNHMLPQAQVA
ncbi:MAG TPA: hypothetical protein VLW55_00610 [Burkholderiaceae bacterium]|nr:hypothetical protein [Burkholderiaceae bacterium]